MTIVKSRRAPAAQQRRPDNGWKYECERNDCRDQVVDLHPRSHGEGGNRDRDTDLDHPCWKHASPPRRKIELLPKSHVAPSDLAVQIAVMRAVVIE